MSKKLCYVLPQYDARSSEHFFHIYELIDNVSQLIDLFLVVERAASPPPFKAIRNTYVLRFSKSILGFIERFIMFTIIRFKGYRMFYVHQSYSSAIASALVTRLFRGQTLYWHCGPKKDYMSKWALNMKAIKAKLFDDYAFLASIWLVTFLVTGSETMRHYYAINFGLPKAKIKVMPNWVNLKRFDTSKYNREQARQELHLETNQKVVLFVHWISPRKGAQHLARIALEVRRSIPDVLFLIVGTGPYMETLKREITENGLEDSFRLVGSVPNREISKYYAVADLLIMPSEEEGFPRVILEAMAAGVPFVATDVGSMMEITTESQKPYVITRDNIPAFIDSVVRLLENNKLRAELASEGINRVKEFSLEKVTQIFCHNLEL